MLRRSLETSGPNLNPDILKPLLPKIQAICGLGFRLQGSGPKPFSGSGSGPKP